MNTTDLFVDGLIEISNQEIPDKIIHHIKRCLLDYTGVTFAGASVKATKFKAFLQTNSQGGNCPVIGLNEQSDYSTAGLLNGFSSHVLELDDGHRYAMLHLEAPIISALLTIAKKEKFNVAQFMKGVIAGYEATVRLASAIQPIHKDRGFHATGTCGTIGVACAIAIALGYDRTQIKNTIAAAATSASGLLAVIDDASQLKPYNVSTAVLNGVTAAYFGKLGFSGPNDVLGGSRGFFKTLTGEFDEKSLYKNTENEYQIEKIYVKPYAACRHAHSAIEGALIIKNREKLNLEDIDKIEVQTYKLAVLGHSHNDIEGVNSAKMSIPYGVAVALILSDAGIEAFMENVIERKDVITLCKKVQVTENEKLTSLSPGIRGAFIKIYTKRGILLEQFVEHPLGEPENSISDENLERKFYSLMKYSGRSEKIIDDMSEMIWTIEDNFDKYLNSI